MSYESRSDFIFEEMIKSVKQMREREAKAKNEIRRTIEEIINNIKDKKIKNSYQFDESDESYPLLAYYLPNKHVIVFNLSRIHEFIKENGLGSSEVTSFLERVVYHEYIHFSQAEVGKELNNKGQSNLVTYLFELETSKELYNIALEKIKEGNTILTEEGTIYSMLTRLRGLEVFFKEFEANAFTYSYEEERKKSSRVNTWENYMLYVNFDKLLSNENLIDKLRESYNLYGKVGHVIASELAKEIGEKLNLKLDNHNITQASSLYFSKYRKKFVKKARKKVDKLIKDEKKRREFFNNRILKDQKENYNSEVIKAIYKTYERLLDDIKKFFSEYKDYIEKSTPLFQKIFRPY